MTPFCKYIILYICKYVYPSCPAYLLGGVAEADLCVSHTISSSFYAHRKTIFPRLLAGRLAIVSTLANGMWEK